MKRKSSIIIILLLLLSCNKTPKRNTNCDVKSDQVILPNDTKLPNTIEQIEKVGIKTKFIQHWGFDVFFEDSIFRKAQCVLENVILMSKITENDILELKKTLITEIIFYDFSVSNDKILSAIKEKYNNLSIIEDFNDSYLEYNFYNNKCLKMKYKIYNETKKSVLHLYY